MMNQANEHTGDAWGFMTGAKGVASSLHKSGVRRVFGIPSAQSTALFEAIHKMGIEVILSTQDQNASIMADAHARITGGLGVCLVSQGQGLDKALAGIAQAKADSSAMLVLVATGPIEYTKPTHQDQLLRLTSVCKKILVPDEAAQIPPFLAQAVQVALGQEPGPVAILLPPNVQEGQARMEGTGFYRKLTPLSQKAQETLDVLLDMLQEAKRIGLYVGAGCIQATPEVAQLAERLAAPVATTLSGMGILPYSHPLCVGFGPGRVGSMPAYDAFGDCDLMLAIGCKFSEGATGGLSQAFPARIVLIDIAPENRTQALNPILCIQSPAKQAVRYLLDHQLPQPVTNPTETLAKAKSKAHKKLHQRTAWTDSVDPLKVFATLRSHLGHDDLLVLDAGHHIYYGIAAYAVEAPRTLLLPADYRLRGFAIPAAIAAQLAQPDSLVIACVDDRGFLHSFQEVLTAQRCNVPLLILLFTDSSFGLTQTISSRYVGRENAVELLPIDYERLCQALNIRYNLVRTDAKFVPALEKSLSHQGITLIELRISYRDLAPYLRIRQKLERRRLPWAASLRLGTRALLKRIWKS